MTRDDLPGQYLLPQVAHATAEFYSSASCHPQSQHIIVVSTPGPDELYQLHSELPESIPFVEPDLGYQMTALAVIPTVSQRKKLKKLPLATGAPPEDLSKIRGLRNTYAHLDLDWKPRPTWEQDRKEFHTLIKENINA